MTIKWPPLIKPFQTGGKISRGITANIPFKTNAPVGHTGSIAVTGVGTTSGVAQPIIGKKTIDNCDMDEVQSKLLLLALSKHYEEFDYIFTDFDIQLTVNEIPRINYTIETTALDSLPFAPRLEKEIADISTNIKIKLQYTSDSVSGSMTSGHLWQITRSALIVKDNL